MDTGISQLDHLHARCMHTHAITVGLCWRQKVVRCKLWRGRKGVESVSHGKTRG